MPTILLIIVIVLLLGGGGWGYHQGYGGLYLPGGIGLVVLILVILLITGQL